MFKKLLGSLIFVSALFLGTNHISNIEAARYSENIKDWNSSALEEFGIPDSYFNQYFDMNRFTVDSSMSDSELNQLERDGLLMFAYEDIIGHAYPSNVNNGITIHFVANTNDGYLIDNDTYGNFEIVSSGGSYAVDMLFLTYIRDLSGIHNSNIMASGGNLVQPRITVSGNKVDLYIPYVYYSKNEREYYAKQLENKLKVLTGSEFDVTFRSSDKSTVEQYDAIFECNAISDSKYVYGQELSKFLLNNEAIAAPGVVERAYNESSVYKDGNYYANPNLIFVHAVYFSDFLDEYANQWHGGVSPYTQRFILGNLIWNLFYSAKVERVVFMDYTLTLRAGKYLDIELSEPYINYYFNEGVIK